MRYLYIHKALWFIAIVVFTAFEFVWLVIYEMIYIAWNFKLRENNIWQETHERFYPKYGQYAYSDKNMWHTIIRRYKYTFDDDDVEYVYNGKKCDKKTFYSGKIQ